MTVKIIKQYNSYDTLNLTYIPCIHALATLPNWNFAKINNSLNEVFYSKAYAKFGPLSIVMISQVTISHFKHTRRLQKCTSALNR